MATIDDREEDRLVPSTNIGGATPTPLGADSGGDLPGSEDGLANLPEPEPPPAPELDGLSIRSEDEIAPELAPTAGREDQEP